jgi:hypothetical protein
MAFVQAGSGLGCPPGELEAILYFLAKMFGNGVGCLHDLDDRLADHWGMQAARAPPTEPPRRRRTGIAVGLFPLVNRSTGSPSRLPRAWRSPSRSWLAKFIAGTGISTSRWARG